MMIHLKKNEKLFINGAVIRLDRRGTVELMNDAQFLLENHIMQPEDASSPLRQLYFVIQTMLIDPANAHLTKLLFEAQVGRIRFLASSAAVLEPLATAAELVAKERYFEALKVLRKWIPVEDSVLGLASADDMKGAEAA